MVRATYDLAEVHPGQLEAEVRKSILELVHH
jgi:hypothetical protein